ncbi:PREDICTED: cytosolic phospholipase A2 epsilon-like [Thamnophis sirtalis]|uniref:Phospholipase A2 n=1 Tax=Thamnophis sirtalis TaxID=35019 RepID=A0A6I9WZZ9_9SAUR|nr:PREDICTED: cytosolic phospholipase A2 epsilon-like [Thamnophis sirtalis]
MAMDSHSCSQDGAAYPCSSVTQSDCYVSLYLPTASVKRMKTQTIKDSKDPVWNETFHFRIQNKVKTPGKMRREEQSKPEGKEELEVEFTMESSPDVPEKILTNGVLVSREVACLEVQVNGGRRKGILTDRNFTLSVDGSYEEAENLRLGYWLCPASPAKFHYIKYNQSDLNIELPRQFCAISRQSNESTTVPLNSLPINEKVTITPDKIFDLSVKAKEWTQGLFCRRPKALDVRLGYGLCSDENNFLQKRKKVVAAALKSILPLGQDLNDHENILELIVHDENHCLLDGQPFTVLFDVAKLQLGETICVTFPLDPKIQENLEVEFSLENMQKELDVRLDYELCPDEQVFIQKRKKIVADALKRVLCMDNDLQDHEVPVVAIMATGGGARAFTALHGHLLGLQKLNLLDCFTYISGSSGSTWTLSNLYEDPGWSQKDLLGPIAEARKNMSKCKLDCFTLDHLKEYRDILKQRKEDGYKTCITDIWGLFIDQALGNGRNVCTLSEQKHALNHGQNPLPLYMVLNTRDKYSLQEFKEWMEFTAFEVGLLKYGAYIRAEDFGSKFFMGRMMKKLPESQICFMKGMWSNVFSYNLLDSWRGIDSSEDGFWYYYTQDKIKQIEEKPPLPPVPGAVDTYLVMPIHKIMKLLRDVITERVTTSKVYNFLNGFQLNNGYLENKNFYIWKDTVLDTFPNQLMTPLEYLSLIDTAAFIDTSYAPLMRPERKVDVIIHLNYSTGSQTAVR